MLEAPPPTGKIGNRGLRRPGDFGRGCFRSGAAFWWKTALGFSLRNAVTTSINPASSFLMVPAPHMNRPAYPDGHSPRAALGIAAQVFLVRVIIGHVMPLFGLEWLDMARGVAAFNFPARVGQLFGVSL